VFVAAGILYEAFVIEREDADEACAARFSHGDGERITFGARIDGGGADEVGLPAGQGACVGFAGGQGQT
jgi:hypothetical protein